MAVKKKTIYKCGIYLFFWHCQVYCKGTIMAAPFSQWTQNLVAKYPTLTSQARQLEMIRAVSKKWNLDSLGESKLVKWVLKHFKQKGALSLDAKNVFLLRQHVLPQQMLSKQKTNCLSIHRRKGHAFAVDTTKRDLSQFLEQLDPRNKLPKYKPEVKCTQCGQAKFITPLAITTRRADEMQIIQYQCSNHKPPHIWKE